MLSSRPSPLLRLIDDVVVVVVVAAAAAVVAAVVAVFVDAVAVAAAVAVIVFVVDMRWVLDASCSNLSAGSEPVSGAFIVSVYCKATGFDMNRSDGLV